MTTSAPETTASNGQPQAQPATSTALATSDDNMQSDGTLGVFSSERNFVAAQRMARALASSQLMPQAYQGNVPNVLIAMEMASRIGASVFMVAQSLDIIHGRPSWSSKFLIATVNASGRFTPIKYRWQGAPGSDDWGCRAVAKERESGEECIGPLVTIALAKAEGWYAKNGSKWKTLPELMLMYRSAGFWTRVYCPELSFGMHSSEEVQDMHGIGVREVDVPSAILPGSTVELEAELLAPTPTPADTPAARPQEATRATRARKPPAETSMSDVDVEEADRIDRGDG